MNAGSVAVKAPFISEVTELHSSIREMILMPFSVKGLSWFPLVAHYGAAGSKGNKAHIHEQYINETAHFIVQT